MRITSRVLELLAAEGRIARGRPTGRDFTSGAWTWKVIDDVGSDGMRQIDDEIERLRGWLGDVRVKWRYPTPITRRLSS